MWSIDLDSVRPMNSVGLSQKMALRVSWRVFSPLRQQKQHQKRQLFLSLLSRRLPAGRTRSLHSSAVCSSSEIGDEEPDAVPWSELEENLKKLGPSVPTDPRDLISRNKFTEPIQRHDSLDVAADNKQQLPIIHIRATYNNTMFTITDHTGHVLAWTSAGVEGFKNSRRGTTFAAQSAGMAAAKKVMDHGFNLVDVKVKGPGPGRQAAVRGLEMGAMQVASIQDVTPIPHNGCRPRKTRRG